MSGVFTFVEMHGSEMASISSEVLGAARNVANQMGSCLLYTSPSPRDLSTSRMPSSA